ncbi:hypothetical protein K505DRAFT_397486 [Melanomma pulvis-pyrius CBS 109.77]|uniref:C3H1-type domain-containing protein n=1 Tax=Melanomma pulvis-pyrius CBS 109.77 TaxID=1314802 RepID=A0A6A6WSE3_9PLEO|nr:hypothetical protein K505DRAFT_397486 [Melanomma pulvis-pyrius CBS 109.77]
MGWHKGTPPVASAPPSDSGEDQAFGSDPQPSIQGPESWCYDVEKPVPHKNVHQEAWESDEWIFSTPAPAPKPKFTEFGEWDMFLPSVPGDDSQPSECQPHIKSSKKENSASVAMHDHRPMSKIFFSEYVPIEEKVEIFKASPDTAWDLQGYRGRVIEVLGLRKGGKTKPNDGKVNPGRYGSTKAKDLGLCYNTFFSTSACVRGSACPWRHDALDEAEIAWIISLGGSRFVERVGECWSLPSKPETTLWLLTAGRKD